MSSIDREICMRLFKKVLVTECYHERMVSYDCRRIDCSESYEQFVARNRKVIEDLNTEGIVFYTSLFKALQNDEISTMDMEHCCAFDADSVYFDKNGKLVIVNPR